MNINNISTVFCRIYAVGLSSFIWHRRYASLVDLDVFFFLLLCSLFSKISEQVALLFRITRVTASTRIIYLRVDSPSMKHLSSKFENFTKYKK